MHHSHERPLKEEVTDLIGEIKSFLKLEIALARTELSPKLVFVGRHIKIIAAGGAITFIGLFALTISAIMGLSRVVPPWLAAFIAGVLFTCCGAFLLVMGKNKLVRELTMPEKTVGSLKEAAQIVKEELK